jgi:hypothetical protein
MDYQVLLTLYDLEGVPYIIDLYENEEIYFNKQFTDITNFDTIGSYSRTFRIPASERNVIAFGSLYNVNVSTWFDFRKKVPATLTVETIPISEGHIQVKTVYSNNDVLHEYEIIFFGETIDYGKKIGDALLKDLDYSDLYHIMSWANINDINNSALLNGDVLYTLTDKGFNFAEAVGYRRIYDIGVPIQQEELTLAVKSLWLFNKILNTADVQYNLDADIVTQLDKIFIPFVSAQTTVPEILVSQAYFSVAFSNNFTWNVPALGGNSVATLPPPNSWLEGDNISQFMDTVVLDVGGNFNATTGEYTAPFSGVFTFEFTMCSGNNNGTNNEPFDMIGTWLTPYYILNGINYPLTTTATGIGGSAPDPSYLSWTFSVTLNINDTIAIGMGQYSTEFWLIRGDGNMVAPNSTWWRLTNIAPSSYGFPPSFSNNAPNISQLDFVKSIIKMFNAVLVPSPSSPNTIDIIPMATYLGSGDKLDWTDKLDVSQDFVIKSTAEMQKAKTTFTYLDDADMFNQLYKKGQQRVFGEQRIVQTDNDFAIGEEVISVQFAATPCNKVQYTADVVIPKFFNEAGTFVIPKCRILYRTPYLLGGIAVFDETLGTGAVMDLPQLSNYENGMYSTTSSYDLNWGIDIPLHVITNTPVNTLYNVYWSLYLENIYSYESRIVEAYFYLTHTDVVLIKFNDIIFVRDSYYRLLTIDSHKVGGREVCKVVLMKYLKEVPVACDLQPIASNENGFIIWQDPITGDTSFGTEACCDFYGWTWIDEGRLRGCSSLPNAQVQEGITGGTNSLSPFDNQRTLLLGANESESNFAERSLILGSNNISSVLIDSVIAGSNANAINNGITLGGGERAIQNNLFGTNQYGVIQLGSYVKGYTGHTYNFYQNFINTVKMQDDTVWSIILSVAIKYFNSSQVVNGSSVHLFAGYVNNLTQTYHLDLLHQYHTGNGKNCTFHIHYTNANEFYIECNPNSTVNATYVTGSMTLQYTQVSNGIPEPYVPPIP